MFDRLFAMKGVENITFKKDGQTILFLESDNITTSIRLSSKNVPSEHGTLTIELRDYYMLSVLAKVVDKLDGLYISFCGTTFDEKGEQSLTRIDCLDVSLKHIDYCIHEGIKLQFALFPNEKGTIIDISRENQDEEVETVDIDYIKNTAYIINKSFDERLLELGFSYKLDSYGARYTLEKEINYNGKVLRLTVERDDDCKLFIQKITRNFHRIHRKETFRFNENEEADIVLTHLKGAIDKYLNE